jgi:hypothetical protein
MEEGSWCEVAEAASSMNSAFGSSMSDNFAERISSMSARADRGFRAVLQLKLIAALDENRSGPAPAPTAAPESVKQEQRRAEREQQELIRQHEQRLPQYREVLDQRQRVSAER